MANYAVLKAAVEEVVKANGNEEITGTNLQSTLISIINSLGSGYQFMGVATPSTTPTSSPDYNIAYIGGAGTYANFGTSITVPTGYIGLFSYNGTWTQGTISLGVTEEARTAGMTANKGFYIDKNHLMDVRTSTATYSGNSSWDCAVIFIDGDQKVTLHGLNTGVSYRYFSSADIFNGDDIYASYISSNTSGIVPDGAVVALVNMQHSSYPNGYEAFYLEKTPSVQEGVEYAYRGFFVDEGHLMEISSSESVVYNSNSSWDCIRIPVEGQTRIVMRGFNGNYRFFDSAEVFTGQNVAENYISSNSSGIVPSGAVMCVLNLSKSNYPNGYGNFTISSTYENRISLLSIGNSYSQDALAYVPFILQNMGFDTGVQIGILMQSSSSLEMHVENFTNETAAYTFYLYDGRGAWRSLGTKTIQWALDNYEWDIVSIQQSTQTTFSWDKYQPWCNMLVNLVSAYVDYNIQWMWYQPMARPAQTNGGVNYSDATITQHYEDTADSSKRIMEETVCEILVPVGTAIQNARTIASIKALGDYASNSNNTSGLGYLTYNDGVHLQEGLPCQIAAYTFVRVLCDVYGYNQCSILGETTRVTSAWSEGKSIPSPHGSPIGSTDENCLIAQKCAIMAIKNPYEVTDMNYIINPT